MDRLEGKVAIVTGAGQGIGKGISLAFAKEGARVVIAEINPETSAATAAEIRGLGHQALSVVCDVSIEEQVKAMVDKAAAVFLVSGDSDFVTGQTLHLDGGSYLP